MAEPKWYVGFDAATKTFGFSLSRVDLAAYRAARSRLTGQARAAAELLRRAEAALREGDAGKAAALTASVAPGLAAADAETRGFIRLVDGETKDLFPGRADRDIATVERLRAVARYVAARVRPSMWRHCVDAEGVRTVIEYQMGANAASRAVAAALVTLFAEEDVIFVGPSLKNKLATCEAGRYCYFAEKYASSYAANKAHARFNFARVEEVFGTSIPETKPASLRGHIADSFMQVLGHLAYGPADGEKAASLF